MAVINKSKKSKKHVRILSDLSLAHKCQHDYQMILISAVLQRIHNILSLITVSSYVNKFEENNKSIGHNHIFTSCSL